MIAALGLMGGYVKTKPEDYYKQFGLGRIWADVDCQPGIQGWFLFYMIFCPIVYILSGCVAYKMAKQNQ